MRRVGQAGHRVTPQRCMEPYYFDVFQLHSYLGEELRKDSPQSQVGICYGEHPTCVDQPSVWNTLSTRRRLPNTHQVHLRPRSLYSRPVPIIII